MENYTSDSSDSDGNVNRKMDLSYLILNFEVVDEHLSTVSTAEEIEQLLLRQNRLERLPDSIARFRNLRTLDISSCGLFGLPEFLNELPLGCLVAKNNRISNLGLPKNFEGLVELRELNLSGNRLTEFPGQLFDLTGLKYLYLGGNEISEISRDIWRLERLQVLSIGGNRLSEVPSTLGQLKSLQALVLCDNVLESIPNSIANLKNLKSLFLHKNQIRTLPTEIITLKNLTELSLRDNPLVVQFVSHMNHDPPTLLELAARSIKSFDVPYKPNDLPRHLEDYLDCAHTCVNPRCKGVFFDNRVEHVKFVDFCGKYRLPLLQYLCSSKCISSGSSSEEYVSGAMMRKVLLG